MGGVQVCTKRQVHCRIKGQTVVTGLLMPSELQSKLLVSPLVAPIVILHYISPYIILCKPFEEFRPLNPKPYRSLYNPYITLNNPRVTPFKEFRL